LPEASETQRRGDEANESRRFAKQLVAVLAQFEHDPDPEIQAAVSAAVDLFRAGDRTMPPQPVRL
jgi:hypothetical protein